MEIIATLEGERTQLVAKNHRPRYLTKRKNHDQSSISRSTIREFNQVLLMRIHRQIIAHGRGWSLGGGESVMDSSARKILAKGLCTRFIKFRIYLFFVLVRTGGFNRDVFHLLVKVVFLHTAFARTKSLDLVFQFVTSRADFRRQFLLDLAADQQAFVAHAHRPRICRSRRS